MGLRASFTKKVFRFNFNARTSRGLMEDKVSWFIKLWDEGYPETVGIGECGPLPGLSLDATPDFENVLAKVIADINAVGKVDASERVKPIEISDLKNIISTDYPAVRFGIETAWYDLKHGGRRVIFENDFLLGKPIPINGLIWMGGFDEMLDQVHKKVCQGFRCIKLKIGGLDFEEECKLLYAIRTSYPAKDVTIRLDANGAFHGHEAMSKLQTLSKFGIHSIEQPIRDGQTDLMRVLCEKSPIPIALDEELIRHQTVDMKKKLLTDLRPAFIILKPTLHGGMQGCDEWIDLADSMRIGWWITSALESSIGLNAVCQYAANRKIHLPQGLGTGAIYQNNIESPLTVSAGHIFHDHSRSWNSETFFS